MAEEKTLEQLVMEAIDRCLHTRCKRCEYGGDISARRENRSCQGRLIADHLRKNGVVVVTQCEDCKHWCRNAGIADSPNGHCFCHDIETNGHDFCSYGERRSDD